jgi:NAD(P)-dependent dehydrogenase (short-subunit alcohol dehydrogenase family)
MGHLDGKNIVVTGAGRGIGRAVALAAAGEGANVVVADFGVGMDGSEPTSEIADAVVAEINEIGTEAIAVAGDIAEMDVAERAVLAAVNNWGSVDGVVCVAGILRERMLFNMTEEEFDSVVRVHLKGHFTVYRHASAIMRKQESGGSIVGFTSGAFSGSIAQANYSAAKGGIVSLTRSAALGLFRYGVRANVIAPVARTRMSANVPGEIDDMGDAEDVAPMVIFLLADASKGVTGQIYTATGGKLAVWNQAQEVREMRTDGRWDIDGIATRFDEIGQEEHPFLVEIEKRRAEAAAEAAKNDQADG